MLVQSYINHKVSFSALLTAVKTHQLNIENNRAVSDGLLQQVRRVLSVSQAIMTLTNSYNIQNNFPEGFFVPTVLRAPFKPLKETRADI